MASGGSTYPSTNERTNYARLCRAIVDLCSDVLRDVLSTQVGPSHLKNKVHACADLKSKPLGADERKKINSTSSTSSYRHLDITFLYKLISAFSVQELRDDLSNSIHPNQIWTQLQCCPILLSTLTKDHTDKIKYASTTGNYSMCDSWLLSQLLTYLCPSYKPKLIPSTNKWGGNSLPSQTDIEYGDDIERIRFLRNTLYGHVSDTCVDDAEFHKQWTVLNGIMSRMDQRMKTGGRYTKALSDIETDSMDDKLDEYISEMNRLAEADKDVRVEINKQNEEILYLRENLAQEEEQSKQLVKTTKHLRDKLKRTGANIKGVEAKMSRLGEQTEYLQIEASSSKTDISTIKDTIAELRTDKEDCVPSNIREQNRIIINKWEKEDMVFIETRGTKNVLELIKKNDVLTVIGNAGTGKSATIHHVALKLKEKGFEILEIHSPAEMKACLHPKKKQVFIIDDPVGVHNLDKERFKLWVAYNDRLSECLSVSNVKFLCSIRKQVINEPDFTKEKLILNRNIIDLQDNQFILNEEEKLMVLRQHLKVKKCHLQITERTKIALKNTHELFPLTCKLFSSSKIFQTIGWNFFQKPFNIILEDLDKMKSIDKLKYCTLIFVFAYENCLYPNKIDPFDDAENSSKASSFMIACGVQKCEFVEALEDNLNSLDGVYLRQEGEIYRFSHDLIHDVVAFHFGQKYPKQMLDLSPSRFISERVVVNENVANTDPYIIILKPSYFKCLLDRLISDLDKGVYNHAIVNKSWEDDAFMKMVVQEFKSNQANIIDLFSRKIVREPVYLEELTNKVNQFDSKQLVSWDCVTLLLLNVAGVTALHWVAAYAHKSLFFLLWNNLSSENKKQIRENVPLLHPAILGGDLDICKEVLEEEHNSINSPFLEAETCYGRGHYLDYLPIHLTAWSDEEIAKLLLNKGAKVDTVQEKGKTSGMSALMWLSVCGNLPVVSLLIHYGTKLDCCCKNNLHILETTEQLNSTDKPIYDRSADIDFIDAMKRTALMFASYYNSTEVVQLLLDHKASIDMQDHKGFTALMLASKKNFIEVVQLLLDHKARIDMQDNEGWTTLMKASNQNFFEVVQLLLDRNASVDIQDNEGRTALTVASINNSIEVVQLLLNYKASIDIQDHKGCTALMLASNKNFIEVVQLLLDHKACIDMQDKEEWTALMKASSQNFFEVVQLLLDRNASVDIQDSEGRTALMMASRNNSIEVVQLLINQKASIDVQDKEGRTALMKASKGNSIEIIQLLLDQKASIDIEDNEGSTALMVASNNNCTDVVQLLLDHKPSN